MTKDRHWVFITSAFLLLAGYVATVRDTIAADAKKLTVPATMPDKDTLLGKMSINGVELQYIGPVEVSDGAQANVELSILNKTDSEICLTMPGIERRLSSVISVKSPKNNDVTFQTFGAACDRTGEGMVSIKANQKVEEVVDMMPHLTEGPGVYHITLLRSYNGIIHFPGYELRLDVPITVLAKKPTTK